MVNLEREEEEEESTCVFNVFKILFRRLICKSCMETREQKMQFCGLNIS